MRRAVEDENAMPETSDTIGHEMGRFAGEDIVCKRKPVDESRKQHESRRGNEKTAAERLGKSLETVHGVIS